MPRTLYYRGDVHLMEIMNKAFTASDQQLQNLMEKKIVNKSSKKKANEKNKMISTTSAPLFRSDQFYKIPFCVHGTFSKKLGILNTELQLMRSNKDTIIFLLWNDDIYFPSQTLIIVGSLAKSLQTRSKDSSGRDGFCVLELTEDGLLDGFVINIELGDGFLLIQTREHTLYGLGDDTVDQIGLGSKNHNFYHEITEIPFEHGQIDFIVCGLTYSIAYTKSKEIYITGEYEYPGHSTWTLFDFDNLVDKNSSITDFQPGYLGMYCLTSNPSDVLVRNPYVFDWRIGSIRRCGYFQQLQGLLQTGIAIQRVESCYEYFAIQLDNNEWYWMHFLLTKLGSYREYFAPFKSLLPLDENICQYEIQNVCGNKSGNSFLVICKIISADNTYDMAMEPYMVFICKPMEGKAEKIQCPFFGRSKWSISNPQITQYFSILTVNEEPSEWFMKRLISCEKWRDIKFISIEQEFN